MIQKLVLSAMVFTTLFLVGNQSKAAEEFEVGGLKVILKQAPKDVISARLFIKGGTANYSKEKEGLEILAFTAAIQGGTNNLDKTAFNTSAEQLGANFGADASYDYGFINMTCIKMNWDKSWELFADAIMNPAFDETEFSTIRDQMNANAKEMESSPDDHLRNIAMEHSFKGTNYETIPSGTAESMSKITAEEIKKYYSKVVGKNNAFLVVVGNVNKEDLISKIEASLSNLNSGTIAKVEKRALITKPSVYVEDRDIATNYIRGLMSAPLASDADAIPMRLAMSILRDRYFLELRTKRSLSYAPAAFYAYSVVNNPYNVIYISTLDPEQSMQVMVDEINKIKTDGFTEQELKDIKQTFLTYHYMKLETSSSQSMDLGQAELFGDWTIAEKLNEGVNNVTMKDLNRVFDQYTNAIQWTYLGKQNMVKEENFVQTKTATEKQKPY